MSHGLPDPSATVPRRSRGLATEAHQNAHGDVVVPAGIGEVVLLPRLWDFEVRDAHDGVVTLRDRSGLVAVVDLATDDGASVSEVASGATAVENLLVPRAS